VDEKGLYCGLFVDLNTHADRRSRKTQIHRFSSQQEDARLLELIELDDLEQTSSDGLMAVNFTNIARVLDTGRNAKQCRDRWKNYLRGGIKKGGWTADEAELIKDMYTTFGPK
jgi:hypothetical protein